MNAETETSNTTDAAVDTPENTMEADESTANSTESSESPAVNASVPEFQDLGSSAASGNQSLQKFLDVKVNVTAELGAIEMELGELMKMVEGSVIELNREVSEPVDLIAQGVRFARGEVVVIDDCFAIRIKEIEGQEGS